jgi:glycine dehydrogenase
MKINFQYQEKFENRHNNSNVADRQAMLSTIGVDSIETLINQTVPAAIHLPRPLNLPQAKSEAKFLKDFKKLSQLNETYKYHIGMGYYDTHTPTVILRNILENPAWYTAYTPYQAEIAQGRLEMLLNYQTMIMDLTGMEIANASLLDEGTAAAEAMTMLHGQRKGLKKKSETIFVSEHCHPQTIDVLKTRALPLGIKVLIGDHRTVDLTQEEIYALVLQYPATDGQIFDYTDLIASAHELGINVVVAADLLALTLLKSPGEMVLHSVLAFRWALVVHTLLSLLRKMNSNARFRVVSSVYRLMQKEIVL